MTEPDPRPGEPDVDRDAQALSRATGGGDGDGPDADSTTGAGESDEFVGRVAGQDVGYAGETGAERRDAAHHAGTVGTKAQRVQGLARDLRRTADPGADHPAA